MDNDFDDLEMVEKLLNNPEEKSAKQWITTGIVIQENPNDQKDIFLIPEEKELAVSLISIAKKYGKFDQDGSGIWAGCDTAEENSVASIGVKCENCVLYAGGDQCRIIALQVEPEGKCRFAIIPDGIVSR